MYGTLRNLMKNHNIPAIVQRYVSEVHPLDLAMMAKTYAMQHVNTSLQNRRGDWSPTVAGVEITNSCTRRCEGCYILPYLLPGKQTMDEELFDYTIDQCVDTGVNFIGLLGGEPLQEHTMPLIERALERHPLTTFVAYTNGDHLARTGTLDERIARRHNLAYSVSLDGFGESHNAVRGPGSFENATAAFGVLRDARKFYGASVTVRRNTVDDLSSREFLDYLDEMGIKFVHIMRFKSGDNSELTPREYNEAVEKIKSMSMEYPYFVIIGNEREDYEEQGFDHRDIMIGMDGGVRLAKGHWDRIRGTLTQESLADIIPKLLTE